MTDKIDIDELLGKIQRIASALNGYTEKLVFNFADIAGYKKVDINLRNAGINYREWTESEMLGFAAKLNDLNLPTQLATCAEKIDLSRYGIEHNRCIDPDLISRLAPDDTTLQMWLFGATKDKGQRQACGCILSKVSANSPSYFATIISKRNKNRKGIWKDPQSPSTSCHAGKAPNYHIPNLATRQFHLPGGHYLFHSMLHCVMRKFQ